MGIKIHRTFFIPAAMILTFLVLESFNLYSQEMKIRIIKKDAVLRLEANNKSEILKALPLGSEFSMEETIGEWIKIRLLPDEDGIIILGYVHKSFLSFSTTSTPKTIVQPKIPLEKSEPIPSQEIDEDYFTWKDKLELAKGKRSTAGFISWMGLIVSFGSFIAEQKEASENYYYDKTPYVIGYSTGIAIGIVGIIIGSPAAKEVKQLKREGERKGYVLASLSPRPKGFCLNISYSF